MGSLLDRLRATLGDGPPSGVKATLQGAMRHRSRIELIGLHTGANPQPLATTIESVDADRFFVAQPVVGGTVRPLVRFAPYTIVISGDSGDVAGEVRVLGRAKVRCGGTRGELYGYRLSMPDGLHPVNTRRELRLILGQGAVREARLLVLPTRHPFFGTIEDIAADSVTVRCRNADDTLVGGAHVHVSAELAPEVGELDETGRIVALAPDPRSNAQVITVRFDSPSTPIEKAMERAGFKKG